MDQDIERGGTGGSGDISAEIGDVASGAPAPGEQSACLSCGTRIIGPFCPACGQKNDDLRRSSLMLAAQFFEDTFGFDSRMWRTLGLMVVSPGLVPANYSHGRRSLYTPPVRLFLVVSFLFFLTLGMTQTLFVAFEVSAKTQAQIAAEQKARADLQARLPDGQSTAGVVTAEELPECQIHFGLRFFIKAKDVSFDQKAWRACVESLQGRANAQLEGADSQIDSEEAVRAKNTTNRVISGIGAVVEDPLKFNADINAWLPRVMLVMTPVLALLLSLFIRGRDALFFDHLVLAFYSHAVGFAVVGATIIAAQLGIPGAGFFAVSALVIYFVAALKRAYKRGWIKTLFTAAFVSFFYFVILSSVVFAIVSNVVWRSA